VTVLVLLHYASNVTLLALLYYASNVPTLVYYVVTITLNFRPIANVSFLSKTIEKVVAAQLTHCLDINRYLKIMKVRFAGCLVGLSTFIRVPV